MDALRARVMSPAKEARFNALFDADIAAADRRGDGERDVQWAAYVIGRHDSRKHVAEWLGEQAAHRDAIGDEHGALVLRQTAGLLEF